MPFYRLSVLLVFAFVTVIVATPVSPLDSIDLGDKVSQIVKDVLTSSNSTAGCIWKGTSPFCDGGCNVKGHVVRDTSNVGDGEKCLTGIKVLCCPSSVLTCL